MINLSNNKNMKEKIKKIENKKIAIVCDWIKDW
jgi:hypothetical protein